MAFIYSKGLQFYTELTDLTKKLQANARTFVSGRVAERQALIAKIEHENKLSAAPPPLAAKPPLPPLPPASVPSLDASFAAMGLHGGSSTPQHWQHTPPPVPPQSYGNAASISQFPPPPPRPPQQSYGNGLPAQYSTSSPHPHALPTPQRSSPSMLGFMPPPPARPVQSSFSPSPASPQMDPYASLGMFTSPASYAGQNQSALNATKAPPPPPPPQQQPQNNFIPQQPQQRYQSSYLTPQALLQLAQQLPYQTQQQQQLHRTQIEQQQQQFGFPLPPQHNSQYGTAPTAQQRNSLQGFPPHQPPAGGSYGRGY